MIRIVGLLLVALTGAGAGIWASTLLHRRASSLEAAGSLLHWLSTRIRYSAAPVGELLRDASEEREFRSLSFLRKAADGIQSGESPGRAWEDALAAQGKACGFTRGDRELLEGFGDGLGRTDIEGQLAHCELYSGLLNDRMDQAKADASAKGRLYTTLGVIGGAAFAILMI